jgi:hypothetical protein
MQSGDIVNVSETLALQALAWIIGDEVLRPRFLDLTGLDTATLRARAGSRDLLAATMGFLVAHEPTLIAAADALDVPPARLVAAARDLGEGADA